MKSLVVKSLSGGWVGKDASAKEGSEEVMRFQNWCSGSVSYS